MGLASAHNSDRNSHLLGQSLVVSTGVLKPTSLRSPPLTLTRGSLAAPDQNTVAIFSSPEQGLGRRARDD